MWVPQKHYVENSLCHVFNIREDLNKEKAIRSLLKIYQYKPFHIEE
jgi:hypothetical protein